MSLETKDLLTPETITQLQGLIQANVDSRDGFRLAAESLDDLTLISAFDQIATDRDLQAEELESYVEWNGAKAMNEGSYAAAISRAWMSIRELLTSNDRYAILAEMERGEDSIKAAYEDALRNTGGSAMNDVLLRHYADVKASHDRIRDLRDACKNC